MGPAPQPGHGIGADRIGGRFRLVPGIRDRGEQLVVAGVWVDWCIGERSTEDQIVGFHRAEQSHQIIDDVTISGQWRLPTESAGHHCFETLAERGLGLIEDLLVRLDGSGEFDE